MQGGKKAPLPGSISNESSGILAAPQRRLQMYSPFGTSCRRRQVVPGLGPRPGIIRAALTSPNPSGASSGSASVMGVRNEGGKAEPIANATSRRPTRTLYKVSDDPLLRQTQILLEASRRLREQTVPMPIVDQQGYYSCSSSPGGGPQDLAGGREAGQRSGALRSELQLCEGNGAASSMQLAQGIPYGVVASFGALAAASATAAARMSAARSALISQRTGTSGALPLAKTTASGPTVSGPTPSAATGGHAALAAAATTASIAAAAAVMPPAASANGGASLSTAAASAASAAATAASSGWLAIEELLEEAAYSLSQELPDAQGPSPLEALMASTSGGSSTGGFGSPPAALGMDLPEQLPESLIAPLSLSLTGLGLSSTASGSTAGSGSLVAAVPGGDKLSEMLEDMLYSLSQDINLEATQEAIISAATAAAAGLAGAAAELPRAAFSVYRSAAEAAAAAAAARAAAALGPTSGGSGGTALVVPDESQVQQASFDEQYDAGEEYDAADLVDIEDIEVGSGNPAWDPYGTIRATEGSQVVPDYGAAAAAATAADSSGDALANAASAAVEAASDGAAAVLPPIVTASAASSLADAATATAMAVVEAATTAAAGTILITPPQPSSAPPLLSSALVAAAEAVYADSSTDNVAGRGAASSSNATVVPSQAAAVPLQPAVTQSPALNGDSAMLGTDTYDLTAEDIQQLDELTAALQNLLGGPEGLAPIVDLPSGLGTASSGIANAAAATAAAAAASSPALSPDDPSLSAAEATMSTLAEALRRELGAVVANATDAVDADPTAVAQSAGQAVMSALDSLSLEQQINLSAMPQDLRLSTLLGATVHTALDLVESALGGIRSADSTLVGSLTIAVVLAVLIRSLVSIAVAALNHSQAAPAEGSIGSGGGSGSGSESAVRLRPVGVTALEAAAALNNDPQALLLDIRNDSDVREQGLPDLRPFRRGTGAITAPLPYCDFRTTPTLANPSGSLLAGSWPRDKAGGNQSSSTALAPMAGTVVVSVDPLFCSKFKQLEGLNRDSRVFLMDSYGVEAPEAVLLLRSDPEIERLLGAQGAKYIEGGFAGPEGWKLTGLPVANAPGPASEGAFSEAAGGLGLGGLNLSGLLSGVARLRLRRPSLFTRTLAVGAVGSAGVAVASSLDWGAVSRGAVALAAAMLLTDRALPPGMRPSGRIRQYLQSQMSETQLGGGSSSTAELSDLTAPRNRTALLLRVLDLGEAVGDAVIRAGGTAISVAGNVARDAIAVRNNSADAAVVPATKAGADDINVGLELETPPSPATGAAAAATIVLPHGMDLPRWSEAAEMAVAQRPPPPPSSSQQAGASTTDTAVSPPGKQPRSVSPLRPNWRLGSSTPADSSSPSLSAATAAATAVAAGPDTIAAAAAASGSGLLPPRSPSPSLAGRLSDALHNAASAIARAASPSRAANGSSSATTRAGSPGGGTSRPDTLELMAALATASALSNVDSGLLPGWPASSFPKASAGQVSTTASKDEEQADDAELEVLPSLSASSRPSDEVEAEVGEAAGNLWSNWRRELEAVAPPPPTLMSVDDGRTLDDGIREAGSSNRGDNADRSLYDSGSASFAASRLDMTSSSWRWGISPNEGADDIAGVTSAHVGSSNNHSDTGDGINRQQSRKVPPLRTSSPERAAAAGAALRRMRLQMDGLDDDGLDSGAYGTGELYGSSDSGGSGSGSGALGKRSGSGSVAVARMAPGRGGLSRGLAVGGQQQELSSPSGAEAFSPSGVEGRQKQPLRTASPQLAAVAAAAMRQLRAELGLPPNDGRDADAVVPRDWRRELDAAAASAAALGSVSESDLELEPAERFSLQGGGNSNTGNKVFSATGDRAAAVATTARLSPSPRNWRAQLEGRGQPESSNNSAGADRGRHRSNGGVPADWRVQIEAASGSGNVNTHGHDSSDDNGFLAQALRTTSPPGRAKLTAEERAARDARLHDWRARV